MKIKDTLPNKPSELIRVALQDLRKVERSKKYLISMESWHMPTHLYSSELPKCYVCLAGAVMAKEFDIPVDDYATPYTFPRKIEDKLIALNNFRCGWIYSALELIIGYRKTDRIYAMNPKLFQRNIGKYNNKNPTKWYKQMYKLVHDLEKINL